jgi:hypothetical protein
VSGTPTPAGQTELGRQALMLLHTLQPEGTVEAKEDYEGDLYLSWPVGPYEAVEVETYETPRTLFFTMHRRAWDRTGGMSRDDELGETSELYLMEAMLRAEFQHIAEQTAKFVSMMEGGDQGETPSSSASSDSSGL